MKVDLPTPLAPSSAIRSPGRIRTVQCRTSGGPAHPPGNAQLIDHDLFVVLSQFRDRSSGEPAVTNVRSSSSRSTRFSMLLARFENFVVVYATPNREALGARTERFDSAFLGGAGAPRGIILFLECGARGAERQVETRQPAVAQKPRRTDNRVQKRAVVRYEHESAAIFLQKRFEDPKRCKIKVVRRLIEQQQIRFSNYGPREHQSILLAAGQFARRQSNAACAIPSSASTLRAPALRCWRAGNRRYAIDDMPFGCGRG
jgi:hypothetical protein